MADQNASPQENHQPAQALMNEALEKASTELDRAVKSCIEQLNSFNEVLAKNLTGQLRRVAEQSQYLIDSNLEDLASHGESLLERLSDFERSEASTITAAARSVRQQISQTAQQTADTVGWSNNTWPNCKPNSRIPRGALSISLKAAPMPWNS